MRKAIFLDRDGVIIQERGEYNYLDEHIIMVDGIVEALKKIITNGFEIIIISNQGGIAKGKYKIRDVKNINDTIIQFFRTYGIKILDIVFCPHHPDVSKCICRKPDSLLIEKMAHLHRLDLSGSWFIGDQPRDVEAGEKAGLKTILINPNDDLNIYLNRIFH